jgi:hypothetical protein
MKRFKIGKEYHYTEIEDLANSFSEILTLTEYGPNVIGESFLVLKNTFDKCVSFIMTRYGNDAYYKCIYKDKL